MKTLYMVFDKKTNFILGAYPTTEIAQFEMFVKISNFEYDLNKIYFKLVKDIPDETYSHLVSLYERKTKIWN